MPDFLQISSEKFPSPISLTETNIRVEWMRVDGAG